MNALRGQAGRLAVVGALVGMVAAMAAPHLGDVTAGTVDTDQVETTMHAVPDTTTVDVTVEPEPTSPPAETSTPTAVDATDTTEAVVVDTTEPAPTGPFPTIAPAPKPNTEVPPTTEPEGAVGPTGADDEYAVTVVAVCVDGTTPVVDFTSSSTADILVTVGGEPNWSTVLAPGANAQGTWPSTDRGPDTEAKWDAQSVDPDPDDWFVFGTVTRPDDCPPPPNTPSAPQNFTTTGGPSSVALHWELPELDGGSPITDYVIQYNPYPIEDGGWTTVDDGISDTTFGYDIGSLENCATYLFRVRADNANGEGAWIDGKDTPADTPCAPPAPSATNVNGQIALEWAEPPSGSSPVTDYEIEYDAHPVDGTWTLVDDGISTNTSFIVSGLTLGTRYSFRVTAVSAAGVGDPSAEVEAVPQAAPTAPRSLTAAATSVAGQIRLTWVTPLSTGGSPIIDYTVQRSSNGTSGWIDITRNATGTTYLVTGLPNGTRWYFRVVARNALGLSPPSNVANAVTRTVAPTAPRSLSAVAPGQPGQVRLSWWAPASNGGAPVTDYVIYRSLNGTSGWTWVNDGVNTATTFTVKGLVNGTRYYFRVNAVNASGWSPTSNVANAVPFHAFTAPRSLSAAPTNVSGQVRLTWLRPWLDGGSPITDYVIYRSPNGTSNWTWVNDGVNTRTSYTVTGLANGTRYYFRVIARNARGAWSVASNVQSAVPRTVPAIPAPFDGSSTATYDFVHWNVPASNGGSLIIEYVLDVRNGAAWERLGSTTRLEAYISVSGPGCSEYRVAARNAAGIGPYNHLELCFG